MQRTSRRRAASGWAISLLVAACASLGGCGKPLTGTYHGMAGEHAMVDGQGAVTRDVSNETVTIEDTPNGGLLLRYGSCALPMTKTSDDVANVVPGSVCDVSFQGFAAHVLVGGTVSRSNGRLQVLLSGSSESPHASYSYEVHAPAA